MLLRYRSLKSIYNQGTQERSRLQKPSILCFGICCNLIMDARHPTHLYLGIANVDEITDI